MIPTSNYGYWFTMLLRTTDGGANWWNVSPPLAEPPTEEIQEMFFLGSENAWIATTSGIAPTGEVSSTTVWRTQDGGQTWNSGTPISHRLPYGWEMVLADDQFGWLMIRGDTAAGSQSVEIFRTMNGGRDWDEISSVSIDDRPPVTGQISAACYKDQILFRDVSNGWVMGECLESGFLLQVTHDGGLSWELEDMPPSIEGPDLLNAAECVPYPPVFSPPQRGLFTVICMFDSLLTYRTSDGGQTWDPPSVRRERLMIDGVDSVDADNGWLVYFDDKAEKRLSITHDGGQTWSEMGPNGDHVNLSETGFVDSKAGWALLNDENREHSSLCKTLDGGITWACLTPRLQPGAPGR